MKVHGRKIVLGRDIRLEHVVGMSLTILVGNFSYKAMNWYEIEAWLEEVWKSCFS